MIEDHEFDECPCEQCGECVFEVAPEKNPPERYCRRPQSAHVKSKGHQDNLVKAEHSFREREVAVS